MVEEKYIKIIAKARIFTGIKTEDIGHLVKCFECNILNYKKGEYIALVDEKFQGIGVVLSGEVAILKENYSGNRTILTVLEGGDTFGEVAAFTGDGVWPSSVQAQSESCVIFINPEKIINYCGNACSFHKIILGNLVTIIAEKAQLLHKKVGYLSVKSTRGRVSKYLIDKYKKTGKIMFSLGINREELADFLNITRPSLSRELCKMRDEGIIEFYKDTIKILQIEKLQKMIE